MNAELVQNEYKLTNLLYRTVHGRTTDEGKKALRIVRQHQRSGKHDVECVIRRAPVRMHAKESVEVMDVHIVRRTA